LTFIVGGHHRNDRVVAEQFHSTNRLVNFIEIGKSLENKKIDTTLL
jgi:hypothetical protein